MKKQNGLRILPLIYLLFICVDRNKCPELGLQCNIRAKVELITLEEILIQRTTCMHTMQFGTVRNDYNK